jgi:hypothetical protein
MTASICRQGKKHLWTSSNLQKGLKKPIFGPLTRASAKNKSSPKSSFYIFGFQMLVCSAQGVAGSNLQNKQRRLQRKLPEI